MCFMGAKCAVVVVVVVIQKFENSMILAHRNRMLFLATINFSHQRDSSQCSVKSSVGRALFPFFALCVSVSFQIMNFNVGTVFLIFQNMIIFCPV